MKGGGSILLGNTRGLVFCHRGLRVLIGMQRGWGIILVLWGGGGPLRGGLTP